MTFDITKKQAGAVLDHSQPKLGLLSWALLTVGKLESSQHFLPSSAQAPTQPRWGLSWLYFQIIQPPDIPEK